MAEVLVAKKQANGSASAGFDILEMGESGPTSPEEDMFHQQEVPLEADDDTLVPNAQLKLRDPSDDSLYTSATGSHASTTPTTPVRIKEANGVDTFEDIARHKIIQVAGDDSIGRKLVLFYCSRLPPSKDYDQSRLLGFLKYTLDQYVENDYSLVVFQYGLTRNNRPSFNWLVEAYRELDRKFKKNLKSLYIVHPSGFMKMLWGIFRHIVSVKFSRKVNYMHHLFQVNELYKVDRLDIPTDVYEHEYRIVAEKGARQAGPDSPKSVFYTDDNADGSLASKPSVGQFGVSIQQLKKQSGGDPIPRIVRETVEYLKENGLNTEGIFRRCPNAQTVKRVQKQYNEGEKVDFAELVDVHIPALILKMFFRELPEPILTVELYDEMLRIHDMQDNDAMVIACRRIVCEKLPEDNYIILNHLMDFLHIVVEHSEQNKMTAPNLAVVFGPNLMWPADKAASLSALSQINSFISTLIHNYKKIFTRELPKTEVKTD